MSNYYKQKRMFYADLRNIVKKSTGQTLCLIQMEELFLEKYGFGKTMLIKMLKLLEAKEVVKISDDQKTIEVY